MSIAIDKKMQEFLVSWDNFQNKQKLHMLHAKSVHFTNEVPLHGGTLLLFGVKVADKDAIFITFQKWSKTTLVVF